MGVQAGSADLENNQWYLVRARMYLFPIGEVPEGPLFGSYPTETLLKDAVITSMLQRRETEAQLRVLALGPTSQLVSV